MIIYSFTKKYIILICAAVLLLGFTPAPIFPESFTNSPLWLQALLLPIGLAPVFPLVMVAIRLSLTKPLSRKLVLIFARLLVFAGILLSIVISAFSGLGSTIALFHGLALTIGVVAGILTLSINKLNSPSKRLVALWVIPTIIAIWSLATVPTMLIQANHIANNRPFCVAKHDDKTEITHLTQLRGLSFYSTSSGYKDTSRWYFHGLLLVKAANGLEAYNWSPRRMTFYRIENPRKFFINPLNACKPK